MFAPDRHHDLLESAIETSIVAFDLNVKVAEKYSGNPCFAKVKKT